MFRKFTVQNEQLIYTYLCNFSWLGYVNTRVPQDEKPHLFLSKPLCFFYCKKKFLLQLLVTLIRWEIQAIKTKTESDVCSIK